MACKHFLFILLIMSAFDLKLISESKCFDGHQRTYSHSSPTLNATMKFTIYVPPVSGKNTKFPVLYFLPGNPSIILIIMHSYLWSSSCKVFFRTNNIYLFEQAFSNTHLFMAFALYHRTHIQEIFTLMAKLMTLMSTHQLQLAFMLMQLAKSGPNIIRFILTLQKS